MRWAKEEEEISIDRGGNVLPIWGHGLAWVLLL